MADYEDTSAGYDEGRGYERRDRSASPRGERDELRRSRSPNGRGAPPAPVDARMKDPMDDEEHSDNPGTNLFVTGIHPRLSEQDVKALFEKYGEVESCSIMLDPHTKESRGFGFVKMVTSEQAEAAKENLQGAQIEGRTLSIEKARRGRPRNPTPGKYFGPPKRGDFRGAPRGGYRDRDRYDDRRGGYGGRRDDHRGPPRGYDDYDRRGYGGGGGGRRERDDSYRIDRYEGGRRDDYGASRDRRGGGGGGGGSGGGGGGGYYDRNDEPRDRGYGGGPPPRDDAPRDYSGGRDYGRDDRYGGR